MFEDYQIMIIKHGVTQVIKALFSILFLFVFAFSL